MKNRSNTLVLKKILLSAMLFFIAPAAFALMPVLHFSDITSGPKTGLGDGQGSGAIVTIWGNNLGDLQGTSKIYIGNEEAAHVYFWGRADGTAASGPANLYKHQKMQAISFSIPATVVDGENGIHVVVNHNQSNALPFIVREGDIFFVKTGSSSNNGNDGSWGSPWATLEYVGTGAQEKLTPGAIVYATDGVAHIGGGLHIKYLKGTPALPYSIAAYPGANVLIQDPTYRGIHNWNYDAEYWNFSKLKIQTNGNGIHTFKGMRAIGNEITNYPDGCADGQGGAIAGGNLSGKDTAGGGIKVFGNYIHNFGCDTTSKLHHVFYITNRGGFPIESFELGWNYVHDSKAHHALHVYDEGVCGNFTGTMKIHNNVVENQVGGGINISSGGPNDPCFSMPIEIYNNTLFNTGQEISGDNRHHFAIRVTRKTTRSHIKIYNNTIRGYGKSGETGYALNIQDQGSDAWNFGGTFDFVNNVIVDTQGLPYESPYWKAPVLEGGNHWGHGVGETVSTVPSWSDDTKTGDAMFISANIHSVHNASPVHSSGIDSILLPTHDQTGIPRQLGTVSAGAYEENILKAAPKKTTLTIN